jgi:hypothetical protein
MDVSAADATSVTDPWEPESWDADPWDAVSSDAVRAGTGTDCGASVPADSAVLALSAVREFVTIGGPEIDRCRI